MNLCRLIYVSKTASAIDANAVQAIAQVSARRNQALGVSGILLATRRQFLQVLEGEVGAVNQVFRDIMRDDRHSDVTLISYQQIASRQFDEWAMKGMSMGLMGRYLVEKLKHKYGEQDGDLVIPLDEHQAFALLLDVYVFLRDKGQ